MTQETKRHTYEITRTMVGLEIHFFFDGVQVGEAWGSLDMYETLKEMGEDFVAEAAAG